MRVFYQYRSPLGKILFSIEKGSLASLWFEGQKYAPLPPYLFTDSVSYESLLVTDWLNAYFKGIANPLPLPLSPQGTSFQRKVWQILSDIPYGNTVTYGQIAQQICRELHLRSMSAQAVGGAVGRNPILICIPCHRVIGANGQLTGYAAGIERKLQLLRLENIQIKNRI